MKKIFLLLFIGTISINCNSQTKSKDAVKNGSQEKKQYLTIKNDSIYFSVKENADSLFIYTSTFGYEKMELKNKYFSKVSYQDSLDYSHFTYNIYKFENGTQSSLQNGIHRGKYFPKKPKYVKKLRGKISTIPIKSEFLKENRDVYIYTPNEFNKNKTYNLLFILDANRGFLKHQCSVIENLVNEKKIENLIVVGIPNRKRMKDDKYSKEIDFRALEFLEGYSVSNHSNHHHSEIPKELQNRHTDFINFLEKEVYKYVISNYKITNDYYKKCIYGTSNGGDFIVALSRNKPDLFGSNIALSFGWDNNVKEPSWSSIKSPNFYLAVGKHEIGYVQIVKKWKAILDKQKVKYKFNEKLSGHDRAMWDIMFVKYIEEIYCK